MKVQKKCFWRLIATVGCVGYLIYLLSSYFLLAGTKYQIPMQFVIVSGIFDILSFIYLMFVPLNYSFYIIWSFIFSYFSLYFGFAVLSINLLLPGMDLAKYYGSFKKNKKQKIGLIITIYMVLLISLKRFGIKFLLISILQIITVLTIFIIIKLTRIDSIKRKSLSPADTEELFSKGDLTKQEKKYLVEVLKGKKYIEIAYNDLVSDSVVKQVLITAYRKLSLNNQKEFLKKYGYIEIEE